LLFGKFLIVDQGLFAQRNTAPSHDGAALVGENHPDFNSAESMIPRSNPKALLEAIKAAFNPRPD
jgi:hypothetical protein